MGKSTHFTGQPVYTQVINLLDKAKIKQLSRQTIGSEKYVKRLDGWTHLIIILFGVLRHYDSLRELEIGMKAVRKQAALAEQARLKEQAAKEQESKANSIKSK